MLMATGTTPPNVLQVGPSVGINSADDLVMSRFLLQRVAEDLQVAVSLDPKVSTACGSNDSSQRRTIGQSHSLAP